ncbi:MAG TPA: O-antigen ligase family protein [Candidatus Kapabacteria bacterium]|nr:O-antigen ligase family protein [Candidatus Kapabacteria bacterium]
MLVWGPLATGATRTSQFLVLLGLGVLLIGFWLVRIWTRDQYRFLFPPFAWVVLAFAGYAIWRYTWVDYEFDARLEILQVILYGVLFFAVLDNLTRQESIQILLFTLIGLGMVLSFYAVVQYLTDSQRVLWFDQPRNYRGRGSATYICPNHLAGFLEMVLPVALAYTVSGRYKVLTKVGLGYAAAAMLAGIGVTLSRGGFLAAGVSLAVFFVILLWNRNFRIPALVLIVLLIAGGAFFGQRSWQAQKRLSDMETASMRGKYWAAAVSMWKENPWFGVGPQHYDWRFRQWRHQNLQGRPVYVHNDYLNTLTEYGVAGAGIVGVGLIILGWSVMRSWKYVRRSNDIATRTSNRSAVVLGSALGLLAIAVHSFTDFNLHIPANAAVAVTLIAILCSHLRFATERFWLNPGIIGRILGTLVLAAAGTYFCWQISKLGPQTYLLHKYFEAKTFDERLEILKRAHACDPNNGMVVLATGELLRETGWEAETGGEELVRASIPWFEKGISLNRWSPYFYMNLGMSYHWLKETDKASQLFDKALAMDPNGYYTLSMYGWHQLQLGDLEAARQYFFRSHALQHLWGRNDFAKTYLEIVERRIAEQSATR